MEPTITPSDATLGAHVTEVDLANLDPGDKSAILDADLLLERRAGRARRFFQDRLQNDLGRILHIFHKLQDPRVLFDRDPLLELIPHLLHGLGQTLLVDRFEEIIERMGLESLEGVFVKGGHKNDDRHIGADQGLDDGKTVEPGHLDIEKNQLGLFLAYRGDSLSTVAALGNHFDVVEVVKP